MTHLKGRRKLHGLELLRDRLGDFAAAVPRVHTPQARDAIEHLAAIRGRVVHAFRARQQARIRLELPIRRERHPKCVELGIRRSGGGETGVHGIRSLQRRGGDRPNDKENQH